MLKKVFPYFLPIVLGIALLPIPLLRDFHFESAMLIAVIGCFWAGLKTSRTSQNQDFITSVKILWFLYISGLPLFISSLVSGCLTIDGVGFWIFIPLPSVFLGAAVGRLIRKFELPKPTLITICVLLFCSIGVWVFEVMNFPQVYFYNHVWGVWPGPIYDESVQLTGSFFFFRWLTFLWIILLWMLPTWSSTLQTKLITSFALLSLVFSYMNLDEAGVISSRESIQMQLGGYYKTEHFDFYYPPEYYTDQEIVYWAARHEFHFQQINKLLEVKWPAEQKIESYLYAHAWQKKKITGAKFTSYVPIWLKQDQLHIAKQQLDGVLKHELVHVISKQFGNQLFNGSWSIGMIEGLAEGIAKDASSLSTLHQVVAAEPPYPFEEEIRSALSVSGFYGSAGAISYTTSGSFVEFLLDNYPANYFKESYASGSLDESKYPPLEGLITEWHHTLDMTPLDSVDQQISEFIFAQRSLFQKPCPHAVSRELQLWDSYQFQLANLDSAKAKQTLDRLHALNQENDLVKNAWVRALLLDGNYEQASEVITQKDTLLSLQVLKADALFLAGSHHRAQELLQKITPKITTSTARTFRYTSELRQDSLQWANHVNRRYNQFWPDSSTFSVLNLPNQMLTLNKALQQNKGAYIVQYAKFLQKHAPNEHWFDIYEEVVHKLPPLGYTNLAEFWVALAGKAHLRLRQKERLNELNAWLEFHKIQ